jgi:NAD(P)-dependent dehydrogenase (short-subunit alcohol dehydrogenase family)
MSSDLDLDGKRTLVTGGSMGIGLEVSRRLAELGAAVIVASRGRDALEAAVGSLPGAGHRGIVLDVSDPGAWETAMGEIDSGGELHGLVTAAALIAPIGALQDVAMDEFVSTIAVNLVGTALALHHAVPRLRAVAGRAVTFSGGGGTSPLARFDAYAASKAGVIRLTENVAADGSIEVNCVSPGFVATRMHDETLAVGPAGAGADYYERTQSHLEEGGFPASEAAELVAFLIDDASRGITGRVISAQWDPWRNDVFRERLRNDPALARLRRIDDQFFVRKG